MVHSAKPHPKAEGLIWDHVLYRKEGHRNMTVSQGLAQMKTLSIKKQHSFSYLMLSTSSFLSFFLHLLATSPTLLGQCGLHSQLARAAEMRVKSIYVQSAGRGWDHKSPPGCWQWHQPAVLLGAWCRQWNCPRGVGKWAGSWAALSPICLLCKLRSIVPKGNKAMKQNPATNREEGQSYELAEGNKRKFSLIFFSKLLLVGLSMESSRCSSGSSAHHPAHQPWEAALKQCVLSGSPGMKPVEVEPSLALYERIFWHLLLSALHCVSS